MERSLEKILMSQDTTVFLLQHLGFVINLQKSKTGTKQKNVILGGGNQFGGHGNVHPRGKNNRQADITGLCKKLREKYNPEEINKSNWEVDFDISSSPPGSSTLSLITNV